MSRELHGYDQKVRVHGQHVTHLAQRRVPVNPRYPVMLFTACGLQVDWSAMENRTIPRKCEACLRALMRM